MTNVLRGYLSGYMSKQAAPAYGIPSYGAQRYLPVQEKRDLTSSENADIEDMSRKWLRGPFASEGDPISRRLADPRKRGLLSLAAVMLPLATMAGGLGASVAGGQDPRRTALAALGGVGVGAAASLPAYFIGREGARKTNKDLIDRMRRLPEGATLRDMMSDPALQEQTNRRNQMATALLMAQALGSRR
jgi:hypothetical protein